MSPLITALATKLELVLARIHTAIAAKLDAADQAADSLLLEGKSAAEVRADVISNELAAINGRTGELPFFTQDGVPMALTPGPLLIQMKMAADDAAINTLKSATVSFSDVFSKWKRISHGNNLVFPHTPAELNSWSYDNGTDRISSTTNSASLIGIVSNDRFDSYEFEAILRSTAADDDGIGICAAFKQVGDREHTLSVMLDGGGLNEDTVVNGNVAKLMVVVNYNQGVANGRVTLANLPLGIPSQSWTGADLAAGVRVLVKRTVTNMLEVTCTRADGSAWPNPIFWTGPIPQLFQSKCPIGYLAFSQAGSTFENIKIPTAKLDIIDTRNLAVWRWNGTTWINAGSASDPNVLPQGRFYKNTEGANKSAYYLDFEGNFITLGSPGVL